MPAESQLEKKLCKWAKDNGISNLKLGGQHDRGKSDRMFMKGGKVLFLEVKAPKKKPTALQMKFLEDRRADGFDAGWTDNLADGIAALREVFDL